LGLERVRQIEQEVKLRIVDERVYVEAAETIDDLFRLLESKVGTDIAQVLKDFYTKVVSVDIEEARRLIRAYELSRAHGFTASDLVVMASDIRRYFLAKEKLDRIEPILGDFDIEEIRGVVYSHQTRQSQQVLVTLVGYRVARQLVKKLLSMFIIDDRFLQGMLNVLRDLKLIDKYEIKKPQ
jgi:hypothetical protein